ncbi:hypothetical protein [Massilia sp. Se16.2.3]|uniref:hypothetical protein n=1 Tax=Massilia sp. Se16.2.3 TaxID=2709303 RepID=UPI0016018FA9|nr:hypothetical protein [Massilia sp. Se16.2.3]QNA98244.1 hypothetical protein G4G31_04325 [Massilia sp. Se16.2.3]
MKLAAGSGIAPEEQSNWSNRRIAAGIAVSLALHLLVLNLQRSAPPGEPAAPARPLAVRLRPPPQPLPAPQVEAAPPRGRLRLQRGVRSRNGRVP